MRMLAITAALGASLAATAFAQTSNTSPGAGGQGNTPQSGPAVQHQVQQDLQQAGFTDIQIMPQSFLVRAKDKHGNPVMMVINPDSITAVTKMQDSGQGSGTTGSANGSSGTSSGTGSSGASGHAK